MIEINKVKKSFDGKSVLKDITLTIPDGQTIVIVGCSGCGKSVLLKCIMGLLTVDQGEIIVDDENVCAMKHKDIYRIRQKFGMLFQSAALFDSMTVEENIGLPLREHSDLDEDEIEARIRHILKLVQLPDVEKKYPAELSGGMKKRVGLARALIINPRYVLFDEPTTGLDPVMADNINELIIETHRKLNITSIVVTHDMESAFKIGDRIAMISRGRIVFHGSPGEFESSKNKVVHMFMKGRAKT